MTRPLPHLTPSIIADEQLLGLAIDRVLANTPEVRELQSQVVTLQRQLRKLQTDEQWAAYTNIEDVDHGPVGRSISRAGELGLQ